MPFYPLMVFRLLAAKSSASLGIIFFLALGVGILGGCSKDRIPQRNADFTNSQDVIRSYYDYRRLENAGIESIQLKSNRFNRKVSIAFYLYVIAQAFEDFDRESDAAKVYLRLLAQYPLLNDGGQLGVLAENRLRWLIGDKSWIMPSLDELILRLEEALRHQDVVALTHLISRDFGFGRTYSDRFAVQYQEGIQLISRGFKHLTHLAVEIDSQVGNEIVTLKTTGWEYGKKIWYFTLQRNDKRRGWEWNLAYWEQSENFVDY